MRTYFKLLVLLSFLISFLFSCSKDIMDDTNQIYQNGVAADSTRFDSVLTYFDIIEDPILLLQFQSMAIELGLNGVHFDFENLELENYLINPDEIIFHHVDDTVYVSLELFPDSIDTYEYSATIEIISDMSEVRLARVKRDTNYINPSLTPGINPLSEASFKIIGDSLYSFNSNQISLRERRCWTISFELPYPCGCRPKHTVYDIGSCECFHALPGWETVYITYCWDPEDPNHSGGGSGGNGGGWPILDMSNGPGGAPDPDVNAEDKKKVFLRGSGKDIDAMCDLMVSGRLASLGFGDVDGYGLLQYLGATDCCQDAATFTNCLKISIIDKLEESFDLSNNNNCPNNLELLIELLIQRNDIIDLECGDNKTQDDKLDEILNTCPSTRKEVQDNIELLRSNCAIIEAQEKHAELTLQYADYTSLNIDIDDFIATYGADYYNSTAAMYEAMRDELGSNNPTDPYQWQLMMETFIAELGPTLGEFIPGIGDFIAAYNSFNNGEYFWGCVALCGALVPGDEMIRAWRNAKTISNGWKAVRAVFRIWNSVMILPGGQKVLNKLPAAWKNLGGSRLADNSKGYFWEKASNFNMRIMEPNPTSNYLSQRVPYSKFHKGNSYIDINGNPVSGSSEAAHIPLDQLTDAFLDNFFN